MLKSLFGKQKNWNFDQVIENLAKTRRLEGFYSGFKWGTTIGKPHAGDYQELYEGSWRRNPEKPATFCGWQDDKILSEFLRKREENQLWIQTQQAEHRKRNPKEEAEWPAKHRESMRRIEMQVPYSWRELSESVLVCFEFDLKQIMSYIEVEEQSLLEKLGVLPTKPVLVSIWRGRNIRDFQPLLKIWFKP